MTIEEVYKEYNASDLLSMFIHKWMARGFIAWVLSSILCQFTPTEFAIALIPTFIFTFWMIRAEWKQYKRWLNTKEGRSQSNSAK